MRSQGIASQWKRAVTQVILSVLAAGLWGFGSIAAADNAPADPGVWVPHKLQFNYLGFSSTYSCLGLQTVIRELLGAMGAAPGFVVTPGSCSRGFSTPDRLIFAQLELQSLQPLSGGLTSDGKTPTLVPGVWKHVEWRPRQPYTLGGGDCELIDEFRIKVMPLFATRNMKKNLTCIPYQGSSYLWALSFDVFAPAPSTPNGLPPASTPGG